MRRDNSAARPPALKASTETLRYETEIIVDAPRSLVWAHLIDFAHHRDWSSTFTLDGHPEVGANARVGFNLFGRSWSYPVVLDVIEEGRRLQWKGGPAGLLAGTHYFLLEPHGDDVRQTRFRHGEDFRGLVVPVVWPLLVRAMGPEYDRFNRELKQRVETGRGSP